LPSGVEDVGAGNDRSVGELGTSPGNIAGTRASVSASSGKSGLSGKYIAAT
jgi:hypothetical protein